MSTNPYPAQQKFAMGAGTAFKFGFFGALGVFVFYLAISIVFTVIGLVLLAAGVFAGLPGLPSWLGSN
jgi:hypothetical protein